MKVLVITSMYPTVNEPTAGIFVKETVENLNKNKEISSQVIAPFTHKKGIFTPIKYLWLLLKGIIATAKGDFDIIHAHYVVPAGLIALVGKYISKKRLVVTAHGSDINILPEKNRLFHYLTKFVLERADAIIAVSRPISVKIIKSFKIPEDKVSFIPCGVDPGLFKPMDKITCRNELKLPPNTYIIFHLSTLEPVKRTEIILQSFKNITSTSSNMLLVIGGEGKNLIKLKTLAKSLEIENKVLFTGYIPHINVPIWMNACDVFILTSQSEGTPVSVVEAMSVGMDIVSTNVGGVPDVVGETETLIDEPTPDKIAQAILSKSMNKNKVKPVIQEGRLADYYWINITNRIFEVYTCITN